MWNNTFLPLFNCESGKFVQTIKWDDQIPRKKFMSKELTEEEFKQRLREAGWTEGEINFEWEQIQADDESGYDGP